MASFKKKFYDYYSFSPTADYTTILNSLVYANTRLPPTENTRRVSVIVSDGTSNSQPVFATVRFAGNLTAPTLDLNGNAPGTDSESTYVTMSQPEQLFPNAFLSDADGDNICYANITLSGPTDVCTASSINFETAFDDIIITPDASGTGSVFYQLTSIFTDCREALVYQSILRGITFSVPDNTPAGVCTLSVVVEDARRSVSNIASGTVEIRVFNAAPFIDLDLGLAGRDYSTVYFQGGSIQHIVSIFDANLARNITDMTVIGEADGEAPFDDGTINHGVVIMEESNAGFILTDVDSPTLEYLQVEFYFSANLDNDVIRYPCLPATPLPESIMGPENGCDSLNPGPFTFSTPACNPNVFQACSVASDLCSDLQVTIFCSTTGRKAYRFSYQLMGLVERYNNLLRYLGYDFLVARGGQIDQIRLLNISVFDGLSQMSNPQATTRVSIRNQDVVIIIVDPAPPNSTFIVYEDERPGRVCTLYQLRVMRLDGSFPAPSELVYNISVGNTGDAFGIDEEGVIFLNNRVDRETIPFYDLTVIARLRNADTDTTASASLIAEVIDVNDNHPIVADSYSVNVSEGLANIPVVRVMATDADIGNNAELTYLLLGIGAEMFQVDTAGFVTTRSPLNVTLNDFYLLVMIITDRGEISLSTHTVINVHVITPPPTDLAFNSFENPLFVFEGTSIGVTVGNVSAFEVGGAGDTSFIRYSLIEIVSVETGGIASPAPFAVDRITGAITVEVELNSEVTIGYNVVIQAFSIRSLFPPNPAFANFTISISDVNEVGPMFVGAPYNETIAENTAFNTVVFTLDATDNDAMNLGLMYLLDPSSPTNLPFTVLSDGRIVVSGAIDFENIRSYSFTVQVRDNPPHNMASRSATAQVNIIVTDQNDSPPIFSGGPFTANVREIERNGYVIVSFSTTDADSAPNSGVSYSVMGLDSTPFCLVSATIQVCNSTLLTSIEAEGTVFSFDIVATNPGTPQSQTITQQTSIKLILVNEFDPMSTEFMIDHQGLVEEDCRPTPPCIGTFLFNFSAIVSDQDGGMGGELSYILETENTPFSLNVTSGILRVSDRIDYEQETEYELNILVEDGGDMEGVVRNESITIIIPIFDLNDNGPVIIPPTKFNVTEEMTNSTASFGSVSFTDVDTIGTHIFTFITPNEASIEIGCTKSNDFQNQHYVPFDIIEATGELFFCHPVDFEEDERVYTVEVEVFNNGLEIVGGQNPVNPAIARISICIGDSNDNPPSLDSLNYTFTHRENLPPSSVVDIVTATDVDSGANGDLVFSIIGQASSTCSNPQVSQIIDYCIKLYIYNLILIFLTGYIWVGENWTNNGQHNYLCIPQL